MCQLALSLVFASGLLGADAGLTDPLPASPGPGPLASDPKGWWRRGPAACGPGSGLRGGWPSSDITFCLDGSGQAHGPHVWFDRKTLRCRELGEYRHGKRHGTRIQYFPSGLPKRRETYVGGRLEGTTVEWYPSGRPRYEVHFQGNLLHGRHRAWHPGGRLSELGWYAKGRIAGPRFVSFYPSGSKRQESAFQGAVLHGARILYYASGARKTEQHFRQGLRHGVWTTWHPGGGRATAGHYAEGRPHGLFTRWDARGRVLGAVRWDSGRVVGVSGGQP